MHFKNNWLNHGKIEVYVIHVIEIKRFLMI